MNSHGNWIISEGAGHKYTGELNFLIKGGGVEFWADGISGITIEESKCVMKPLKSPFIEGSKTPPFIRHEVRLHLDKEFSRMAKIIADKSNPLERVKVIVNNPAANLYFLELLKKYGLDGEVINP